MDNKEFCTVIARDRCTGAAAAAAAAWPEWDGNTDPATTATAAPVCCPEECGAAAVLVWYWNLRCVAMQSCGGSC